jgi:hypothetical protein
VDNSASGRCPFLRRGVIINIELMFGPSVSPDDSICECKRLLVCMLLLDAPFCEGLKVSSTGLDTRFGRSEMTNIFHFSFFLPGL